MRMNPYKKMNSFLYFRKFIFIVFLLYYFYLNIDLCKYIQDKYIKIEINFLIFLFLFLCYIVLCMYEVIKIDIYVLLFNKIN